MAAAENLDLGPEEPDAGIAAGGDGFDKEVPEDVEPAQHGDRMPN
jgi:hypothetical protein